MKNIMIDQQPIGQWVDRIDTELVRYFSGKDMTANPLDRAMEYTVLAGGKRIRPLLTMVTCAEYGGDGLAALPIALASELLHTYSLIHDDLPCMDDDQMRRGKPTNHIIFGEANAILAADALQAEAFAILAGAAYPGLDGERRSTIILEMAEAVGRRGMVAGQVMDLALTDKAIDLDRLELLHRRKTGHLLRFCVRLGGVLADVAPAVLVNLSTYADAVGLMFQVVDDLLDQEGDSGELGKTAGKDSESKKSTFPKLLGAEAAHRYADRLLHEALAALAQDGKEDGLLGVIASFIRRRNH